MSQSKGSEKNWSRYSPLLFATCCAYMVYSWSQGNCIWRCISD